MATTSIYGLPYPVVSTDPPNGAAQIQALAEGIEALLQGNLTLGGRLTVPGGIVGADTRADLTSDFAGITTTSFVDITGLAVTLLAGARYQFEMCFMSTGDGANDAQFNWSFTNSATWWASGMSPTSPGNLSGTVFNSDQVTYIGVVGATTSPVSPAANPGGGWPCANSDLVNPSMVFITGQVLVGGSNSVVQGRGRKFTNTVTGTPCTVRTGTYMKFTRLS